MDFCRLKSENIRVIENLYRCGSNRLLKYMDRNELHPEAEVCIVLDFFYTVLLNVVICFVDWLAFSIKL